MKCLSLLTGTDSNVGRGRGVVCVCGGGEPGVAVHHRRAVCSNDVGAPSSALTNQRVHARRHLNLLCHDQLGRRKKRWKAQALDTGRFLSACLRHLNDLRQMVFDQFPYSPWNSSLTPPPPPPVKKQTNKEEMRRTLEAHRTATPRCRRWCEVRAAWTSGLHGTLSWVVTALLAVLVCRRRLNSLSRAGEGREGGGGLLERLGWEEGWRGGGGGSFRRWMSTIDTFLSGLSTAYTFHCL